MGNMDVQGNGKPSQFRRLLLTDPSRIAKGAALAVPVGVLIAQWITGAQLSELIDKQTIRELLLLLFWWGPALWVLAGFFMLLKTHAPLFIIAQQAQASALSDLAHGITEMKERRMEDQGNMREILINLRVLSQKVDELREETKTR